MLAATDEACCLASAIKDKCPACSAPMVGTSASEESPDLRTRASAIVRTTSMPTRLGPRRPKRYRPAREEEIRFTAKGTENTEEIPRKASKKYDHGLHG